MIKETIYKIAREARQRDFKPEKDRFNFFQTISDTFYRENFHSDILQALLRIEEFYDQFMHRVLDAETKSKYFDFSEVKIEREKGRIDVSIVNYSKNKAIIIENKINNAGDTYRQLPKYIEYLESGSFEVPLVIYLSIDGIKKPTKFDWSDEEKAKLKTLFKSMSAMQLSDKISLEEILYTSAVSISNIDQIVFIRQYLNLLKHLTKEKVNYKLMENLYNEIRTRQDLDDLFSLRRLINDLPKFRATRLKSDFEDKPEPFEETLIWKDTTTYFNNLTIGSCNFALDITCYEDYYEVSLFDRNAIDNQSVKSLIQNTEIKMEEKEDSSRLFKYFSFPTEELELSNFVDHVKKEISKKIK